MSKSDAFELDILNYVLAGAAPPWDVATHIDVHLHVADPGEAGTTETSPATYGGYSPATVARSPLEWAVTSGGVNANMIQFPTCVSGANTITHVSLSPSGSTEILWSGAVNVPVEVIPGVQPKFSAGALTVTEN